MNTLTVSIHKGFKFLFQTITQKTCEQGIVWYNANKQYTRLPERGN